MKKKIAGWMLAGLLSGAPAMAAHQADTLDVLFWNLENFFDYRDQGTSESDAEFSGRGLRHWTKKRFLTKCNAVAKTLLWTAGQTGRMPDVVAVAEVENRFVLKQLLRETALRKQPWGIAHYESPDHRGIDVGLLWRTDRWDTVCTRACHVFGPDGAVLPTRDILLVQLQRRAAPAPAVDRWAILVNHHPSKYGGSSSAWRREAAVDRLRELCDSLRAAGWSRIVATGDFNDTADAPLFQRLDALENLALPLAARGQGTIRFNGRWELIDLFFLSNVPAPASSGLASPGSAARMTILHPPFLTERDKTHSGEKPRRTYIGPRYNGLQRWRFRSPAHPPPPLLPLPCPSLAPPLPLPVAPCHSLSLPVAPCHSLPLPVAPCRSLSLLVAPCRSLPCAGPGPLSCAGPGPPLLPLRGLQAIVAGPGPRGKVGPGPLPCVGPGPTRGLLFLKPSVRHGIGKGGVSFCGQGYGIYD